MTNFSERAIWLQERSALQVLAPEILAAIAPRLEERQLAATTLISRADTPADGLYILISGHAESDRPPDRPQLPQAVSLLPGAVINLQALLLQQPVAQTVVCQSECHVWYLPAVEVQTLASRYPEMAQTLGQQLAAEVTQLTSQLQFEQERQGILRPYLVTKARRGVIGRSRYALRLRKQLKQAAAGRQSLLLFGEPGLEKDNLAALIHYGSANRREPIIRVDCNTLQASGAELFGRVGGKLGLLAALGEGTLILNNLQELPPELVEPVAELLQHRRYRPVSRGDAAPPAPLATTPARLIAISERALPAFADSYDGTIKVPPLRVRKADLEDLVNYYTSLFCRAKGRARPCLTPEALRRLQAYDFPNNLRELESLVQRALVQLGDGAELTEEIIWPSQSKKKQFRLNLLNAYPSLRRWLRSPWWPNRLNYGFTLAAFAAVVILLFVGPQTRDRNVALLLFWAWWWPLVLLSFLFVGRLWCAICPFMIYGELVQTLSLRLWPRTLRPWPRQAAERWGGWFLFAGFALILLWEELWNLENTAYLSSWLLLLITAGAVICSSIFERRFWCRYLCPIGGMNGLFAKLSITELRAQQGTCSAECTTYQCYKGGPQKGEGQETEGCPLYSHPAQLADNRDCVLCMTCLKACPHRSVELNLRPPGIELWTTHEPRAYEVALLLLLLNVVFLHRLPVLNQALPWSLRLENFGAHALLAIAALSLPALIPLLAQALLQLNYRLTQGLKPRRFLELAYGYLPLVLAGNLAYYLPLGLGEAGRLGPVSLATWGLSGAGWPVLVAHPAAITFLQGTVLLLGSGLAVILTQKIARQPLMRLWPQHAAIATVAVSFWAVLSP